jgi:hypothetical protein
VLVFLRPIRFQSGAISSAAEGANATVPLLPADPA